MEPNITHDQAILLDTLDSMMENISYCPENAVFYIDSNTIKILKKVPTQYGVSFDIRNARLVYTYKKIDIMVIKTQDFHINMALKWVSH